MKKSIGFYIFIGLTVVFVGVCIWSYVVAHDTEKHYAIPETPEGYIRTQVMPDNDETGPSRQAKASVEIAETSPDKTLLNQSLEDGFTPTQETGELGSKNGALFTNYPMNYKPTKYERLANSPLLVFTDDMIWPTGTDTYSVKKDAMRDQAKTTQEASVALSISPQVEYEKTLGYRLVEIPEGTLFSKLGMVSGDVIVSINGTIPDMEPMALMFINMVAGKRGASTIVVDHRGKKRTIQLSAVE